MTELRPIPVGMIFDPVGDLGILSHFAELPIIANGLYWPTNEHYFQAEKFLDEIHKQKIRNARNAADAKHLGWQLQQEFNALRPDWELARANIMLSALRYKFLQHPKARDALKHTWPFPLYEDSVDDSYWGIGSSGQGLNLSGNQLSRVRNELYGFQGIFCCPPLYVRPVHEMTSRYGFVLISTQWNPPAQTVDSGLDLIRSSALTELSIPDLVVSLIRQIGIVVTEAVLPVWPFSLLNMKTIISNHNPDRAENKIWKQLLSARRSAFDTKYATYRWDDDARAVFPNWAAQFEALLIEHIGPPSHWKSAFVVGAGAGEEAQHVWARFGSSVTLSDIGPGLSHNCESQARESRVIQASAEDLSAIGDASVGLYCALRTFESTFFDKAAAIVEANRILRPGGHIVLSTSCGYQGRKGEFVHGRLVPGGKLDLNASFRDLCELHLLLSANGFESIKLVDLQSEWGIIATKTTTHSRG